MKTAGERIIDAIVDGALCHASCATDPAHNCVVVWSSGAAEQLDAIVSEALAAKDAEIVRLQMELDATVCAEQHRQVVARAERAEAELAEEKKQRELLSSFYEGLKEVEAANRAERDQLRAEVERLGDEHLKESLRHNETMQKLVDTEAELAAAKEDVQLLNDSDRYLGDAQLKDGSFPFPDHPQPVRVALRAAIDQAREAAQ